MAKNDKKSSNQEKQSVTSGISKKFKQSPALYIGSVAILVLVTVTFIGGDLLSGGAGHSGGDLVFGYYDNAPISWVPGNMFSQYYERAVQLYRGQGMDPSDSWIAPQIWRQAYEAAAVHIAVLQVMKKSNYIVPEKTVDRNVARLPQFQANGVFSPVLYNQMSESSQLTLWRQTQDELTKMMFFMDSSNTLIPSSEADFIANMSTAARSFDMVSFKVDDYPNEEFLSFAQANSELFATIHLSRIFINNEREIRRILDNIKNGTALFEDAARSQSQDNYADRGGDMGSRYCFDLEREIPSPEARSLIFNLAAGELSDVINTGDGWAIFRVEEALTQADFEDAAVMDRVRSYVRGFQRGRMEDWAIAQARDFIEEAKEFGFDSTARWRFLDKQTFGPLPLNYGSVDLFPVLESFTISGFNSQELGNISRNEDFWRVAFSAEIGSPSEPFVHGNNVFVFLPIDEIESEEGSLDNIASMYSSYWMNYVADQSLQSYFINHTKMDDNFWDVYFQIFRP